MRVSITTRMSLWAFTPSTAGRKTRLLRYLYSSYSPSSTPSRPRHVSSSMKPRRPDLAEADAVLVERERIGAREPGLDGEVDPGVDRGIGETPPERGRVRVRADARPPLDARGREKRAHAPLVLASPFPEHVPLDLVVDERPERVLDEPEVFRVEPDDLGKQRQPDRVLRDRRVGELLEGVEEEHVRDLALEQRERPTDVDRADVLLDLGSVHVAIEESLETRSSRRAGRNPRGYRRERHAATARTSASAPLCGDWKPTLRGRNRGFWLRAHRPGAPRPVSVHLSPRIRPPKTRSFGRTIGFAAAKPLSSAEIGDSSSGSSRTGATLAAPRRCPPVAP